MNKFDKKVSKEVKSFLDENIEFTTGEAERIRRKAKMPVQRFNLVYWIVLTATISVSILLALSFLPKDNQQAGQQIPDFEQYKGEALTIGVIGNPPKVREKELIHFEPLTFQDLIDGKLGSADAVFIMKEKLIEASESQYARVYLEASVPFFFIESTQGITPFTVSSMRYRESPEYARNTDFASGYRALDRMQFGFGLYKDIKNAQTIAGTYSEIFERIDQFK